MKDNVEYIAIVDKNDTIIGKTTLKQAKELKKPYRLVSVIVLTPENHLIIQKRSATQSYPHHYAESASGHVQYGETYEQAANRELYEELGIKTELKALGTLRVMYNDFEKIVGVFIAKEKILPQNISINKTEIEKLDYIPSQGLKLILSSKKLTPVFRAVIEKYEQKINLY